MLAAYSHEWRKFYKATEVLNKLCDKFHERTGEELLLRYRFDPQMGIEKRLKRCSFEGVSMREVLNIYMGSLTLSQL